MNGEPGTRERIDSLDAARGCAIFLMIFVNFAAQYPVIPPWSKHAVGDGFTYVDAIAPTFIFIMGISAALSFARRREARGAGRTVLHALLRYGVLFLFGAIGTVIVDAALGYVEWNIFETLAVAGLFAFPFLFIRPPALRIVVALALMALYQAALSLFLGASLFHRQPAPLFLPDVVPALALATIFLLGSGLAEAIRRGRTGAAAAVTGLLGLGAGLGLWSLVAPNRSMGSITYLLLGIGSAAACLLLFWIVERGLRLRRVPLFSTLGRNSLVIFMIASVATKVLNVLLSEGSRLPVVLLTAALLEAFCLVTAIILDQRGIYIKL